MTEPAAPRDGEAGEGRRAHAVHPFVPARGLGGFHRQTLTAAFLRSEGLRAPAPDEAWTLEPDAETRVRAEVYRGHDGAPAVIVVHGLTGHARSSYVRGVARKARRMGWHVVALNLRGAGGTEADSPRLYHAGLVDDLGAAVQAVRRRLPIGDLHLLGFSLGGNIVLRFAGLLGARAAGAIDGVVAVSPALDLAGASHRLDHDPALKPYRDAFLRGLRRQVRARAQAFPERWDAAGLHEVRTIRGFDERYVAPDAGFSGADDYYARASATPVMCDVAVPVLVLHARDDRLVSAAPLRGIANTWVQTVITERGGHCAFVSRGPGPRAPAWADRFWAETEGLRFLLSRSGGVPR